MADPAGRAHTNLGLVLHRWRINEGVTLRQAAKLVGISAATWMRLEHGYKPEGDTLVKLLVWFMRPPFPAAREQQRKAHPSIRRFRAVCDGSSPDHG